MANLVHALCPMSLADEAATTTTAFLGSRTTGCKVANVRGVHSVWPRPSARLRTTSGQPGEDIDLFSYLDGATSRCLAFQVAARDRCPLLTYLVKPITTSKLVATDRESAFTDEHRYMVLGNSPVPVPA